MNGNCCARRKKNCQRSEIAIFAAYFVSDKHYHQQWYRWRTLMWKESGKNSAKCKMSEVSLCGLIHVSIVIFRIMLNEFINIECVMCVFVLPHGFNNNTKKKKIRTHIHIFNSRNTSAANNNSALQVGGGKWNFHLIKIHSQLWICVLSIFPVHNYVWFGANNKYTHEHIVMHVEREENVF